MNEITIHFKQHRGGGLLFHGMVDVIPTTSSLLLDNGDELIITTQLIKPKIPKTQLDIYHELFAEFISIHESDEDTQEDEENLDRQANIYAVTWTVNVWKRQYEA